MTDTNEQTRRFTEMLREACRTDNVASALDLLRKADTSGRLSPGTPLFSILSEALGPTDAARIVEGFAADRCPYCKAGRESCAECEGKGHDDSRPCATCAGLGLRRCPFCNGTSLAGYDLVPRALLPQVLAARLSAAEKRLALLSRLTEEPQSRTRDIALQILEIDQCRGALANAVEQAVLHSQDSPAARQLFTTADLESLRAEARRLNSQAETAIRSLLKALADHYASRAESKGPEGARHSLYEHRAEYFRKLAAAESFNGSVLETPRTLAPNG